EGINSVGRVLVPRAVVTERTDSDGGVGAARGVAKKRIDSVAGVDVPRAVAKERIGSGGGVVAARGVVLKSPCSQTGVVDLRRCHPRQTERENDRNKDGEKRCSVGRTAKHIKTLLYLRPELSCEEGNSTDGDGASRKEYVKFNGGPKVRRRCLCSDSH